MTPGRPSNRMRLLPQLLRFALIPLSAVALLAAEPAVELKPDEGSLDAAHGEIDRKSGQWHFWDKVHLFVPGTLELWCEDLVVIQRTDAKGKRITDRIVARTNVVLVTTASTPGLSNPNESKTGETNRATAFQALFDAAQGTIELTGEENGPQPKIESKDYTLRGNRFVFDRANGRFKGDKDFLMIFKATAIKDIFKSTNSPAKTAAPAKTP